MTVTAVALSILIIGDSITNGMMPYLPAAFQAVLPAATVYIEAEDGTSIRTWLRDGRLRALVDARRPDLVVVGLGTNDEGREGTESYRADVEALARDARRHGASLVWIGPYQDDAGGRARLQDIQSVLPGSAVDGVGLAQGLERAADGIHLRMPSYRTLAERLARTVAGRAPSESVAGPVVTAVVVGALLAVLGAWLVGR